MFRQNKKRLITRRNNFIDDDIKYHDKIEDSNKLSFYTIPPNNEISLIDFEKWSIERLKILMEIDKCINLNRNFNEIENIILPKLKDFLQTNDNKDLYSHYILRLAFSKTKELRTKFINLETILFKIRYLRLISKNEQIDFLKNLNLPQVEMISDDEKNKFEKELKTVLNSTNNTNNFENEIFLKIPFENCIDLLSSRSIFLNKGYGFVSQSQQIEIILNEYSKILTNSLIKTFTNIPKLNEDDRLIPILNHLSSGYIMGQYQPANSYGNNSNNNGDLTAESIYSEEIMKRHPLCMRYLLEGLRETHHLRYNGRQQLGLYLKGIGLSIDEAMRFWINEFVNAPGAHMTIDKFNKEYKYNIRHNYGLEGNRVNYKPWDYKTILGKPRPAKNEYHGSPYRDFSEERLKDYLITKMNLNLVQVNDVLDSCKNKDYLGADTKVFEYLFGKLDNDQSIVHPNQYYDLATARSKKEEEQ